MARLIDLGGFCRFLADGCWVIGGVLFVFLTCLLSLLVLGVVGLDGKPLHVEPTTCLPIFLTAATASLVTCYWFYTLCKRKGGEQ